MSLSRKAGSDSRSSASASASLFSLPLAPWQQPRSLRTLACESRRKRKSDEVDHSDHGEDEGEEDEHGHEHEQEEQDRCSAYSSRSRSRAPSSQILTLTPDEQRQYLAAGLPLDSELPGDQFPHRAPTPAGPRSNRSHRKIFKDLSTLREPLFDPIPTGRRSLRLQHLAVITTILHRCLMAGDYLRAGRAWGLILRDSFAGTPVQVKYTARWGIGAEILLWSDFDRKSVQPPPYKQWFTRKGFEKAKDYYERLILQYPYSKSHPHSLNPLDFYPAMFGLWISIAQEESRAAREANPDGEDEDEDKDDSLMELGLASDIGDVDVAPRRRHDGRRKEILTARSSELAEAEKIATELDKVLLSPPYSDSPRLLELRGMILQWVGDLHVSSVTADDPDNMPMPVDDVQLSLDYRLALERRQREIMKAEGLFEKARKRDKRGGCFSISSERIYPE